MEITPLPPLHTRGPRAHSHFPGKGGIVWPFVSAIFSREKPEKGVFSNQPPEDTWDISHKLPEETGGGGGYTPSTEKGGRVLIYCMSM